MLKSFEKEISMNVAFVCTGEFEPFFYECVIKNNYGVGINPFYVAFFADTRAAVKKIKKEMYPKVISFNQYLKKDYSDCLLEKEELEDVVYYDSLRRSFGKNTEIKRQLINKAVYYEYFFRKFYSDNHIEAVVVWNYFPVTVNVAWRVAKKLKIKTIFFENGPLSNTLMIDSQGVNFQSSLALRKKEFFENQKLPPKGWKKYLQNYPQKRTEAYKKNRGIMNPLLKFYYALLMRNKKYRRIFPELTDDNIRKSLWKKMFSRIIISKKIKLPKKFVFIPFQYSHDTQVLVNSPFVANMEAFLDSCYSALKEVDSCCRIVVKEHPDDFCRKSYKKLRKKYPDVVWLAKYDIQELIRKSQAVITINSSVGIAALVEEKPVITLGKSFYNIDGVVYYSPNLPELRKSMKKVLSGVINKPLINRFLYYLRFEYLAEGNPRYCTVESLAGACRKLEKILMEKNNE